MLLDKGLIYLFKFPKWNDPFQLILHYFILKPYPYLGGNIKGKMSKIMSWCLQIVDNEKDGLLKNITLHFICLFILSDVQSSANQGHITTIRVVQDIRVTHQYHCYLHIFADLVHVIIDTQNDNLNYICTVHGKQRACLNDLVFPDKAPSKGHIESGQICQDLFDCLFVLCTSSLKYLILHRYKQIHSQSSQHK